MNQFERRLSRLEDDDPEIWLRRAFEDACTEWLPITSTWTPEEIEAGIQQAAKDTAVRLQVSGIDITPEEVIAEAERFVEEYGDGV
jgi:hypothetical protein